MSKDAWSTEALWFQFAREGAGWLAVEWSKWKTTMSSIEKCTELPRSNCDEDIMSWFRNVRVECKERERAFGADFWGILPAADCLESSVMLYTDYAVILCGISLFSPLCLLGWRHKGCVEHPEAICFDKMAQFVYTLITEPDSRTRVWLLLFMIQDAFDLGSGTLQNPA